MLRNFRYAGNAVLPYTVQFEPLNHYFENSRRRLCVAGFRGAPKLASHLPTSAIKYIETKADHGTPYALKVLFLKHCTNYHGDSISVYCSKSDEELRCAGISSSFTDKRELPNCSSIFSSELYAILAVLMEVDKLSNCNYTIFSDSRNCIQIMNNVNNDHTIAYKI